MDTVHHIREKSDRTGARIESIESVMDSLHAEVLQRIDLAEPPDDEALQSLIHTVIKENTKRNYMSLSKQIELGKALFHSFRKLDLLEDLIDNPDISEVMVNGANHIFIERNGALQTVERTFSSEQKLQDIVQQIAAGSNRIVNEANPVSDARLRDGSRCNIVLPPIALDGPVITIRKFPKDPFTMKRLLEIGSLHLEAAEFLRKLVVSRYNIFISGGTGSGKTTFLNALSAYIPKDERIITIEDNAELQLLDKENLVRLEARGSNTEGSGEISIRTLIRTALRMRPDRIIVGEVRQEEAIDMIQAMNTGHDGSLSTGHANSPADMLVRLETMILFGMDIPLPAIQRQLASGLDFLIHLGRLRDKTRKVLEITEVLGYEDGAIQLNPIYRLEEGGLKKVGALVHTEKMEKAGLAPFDS